MYEYLKSYVVENELEDNNLKHVFYLVSEEDIHMAEVRMGRLFPDSIKEFYTSIGYGYFEDVDECFTNLLMPPNSIADFYCREADYYYSEEREFLSDDDFVFFEVDCNCHIVIKTSEMNKGKIYFGKRLIADSLQEFIKKLDEKSIFFIESDNN